MVDNELAAKLYKQIIRNESDRETQEEVYQPCMKVFNPYTEFKEFTRKDIQNLEKQFKK
jgi:EF-hand domain-containing family member D2